MKSERLIYQDRLERRVISKRSHNLPCAYSTTAAAKSGRSFIMHKAPTRMILCLRERYGRQVVCECATAWATRPELTA